MGALHTDARADSTSVELRWGVRVPMRDGVTLHATLYLPKMRTGPLPVIVSMTPYTSDHLHQRGRYFAQHGYIFAAVDVRGRGNSEGAYAPFVTDARDGHDAVEWLATLPESDGQVGMWGGSYGGFAQWAAAKERPPHLRTIVPAASVYPGHDFPTLRGITFLAAVNWLAGTAGHTANDQMGDDSEHWMSAVRELHARALPLTVLDSLSGFRSPIYREWLAHPTFDQYWQAMVPTPAEYAAIDIPVLTITGYYDVDQPGALRYYREHVQHGSATARARHVLLLGPWDHAGTRTPTRSFSGVRMGPRSVLDLDRLHVAWYDHVMKGAARPTELAAPVRYYQPGDDRWRDAPSLAAVTTRVDTLFLAAASLSGAGQKERARARRPGRLQSRAPAAPWREELLVDLQQETSIGRDTRIDPYNYASTARYRALGRDALVFESAPFASAQRFAGQPRVDLSLTLDAPDADIAVDLYDVSPTGEVLWLSGDQLRARYRNGQDVARLPPVGVAHVYRFDQCTTFARRVDVGHRLRLVITTPHLAIYAANYGGAAEPSDQIRATTRPVRITLDATSGALPRLLLPRTRSE